MKKEQEHKMATGLAVHTNLVAGFYSCFAKEDNDAVNKCMAQFNDRRDPQGIETGWSIVEEVRCLDSC